MTSDRIDLWCFRFRMESDPRGDPLDLLDVAERERYRQFATAEAAEFFAFRRAARRVVLAKYLNRSPESLRFDEGVNGKPSLGGSGSDLFFSTADTGTTGVIALRAGSPVGVDIERHRSLRNSRLEASILSPAERRACQSIPPQDRSKLILGLWTQKEALVKGMGTGLDLAAFREITLAIDSESGSWRPALLCGGLERHGSWYVLVLSLWPGQPEAAIVSIASLSPAAVTCVDAAPEVSRHGLL